MTLMDLYKVVCDRTIITILSSWGGKVEQHYTGPAKDIPVSYMDEIVELICPHGYHDDYSNLAGKLSVYIEK